MEALYNALRKNPNIAAWKVNVNHRETCELFYVQKKVETVRATETVDYTVTIYVDKGEARGQSTFAVYPYMGEKEIERLIEENVFAASFALNKFYEIPEPEPFEAPRPSGNLADKPFAETIKEIGEAIMKANAVPNASLSATEIFLNKNQKEVHNSKGVDVSFVTYECKIETIPNYVHEKEEVEIYQPISFSLFNSEELTAKIAEAISVVKDRAEAIKMPEAGSIPVIIDDEESVAQFFYTIADDLNYQAAYTHSNLFEIGQNLQEGGDGDPLTIEFKPIVDGAINSSPIDGDGVVLKPVTVIDAGVTKSRFGSYRFGFYLGEKHPTGQPAVLTAAPGTLDEKEIAKAPYLRCVRFSGIQTDLENNFFGGEVRLGYYFDGKKEIPVTGFSIQGDYKAAIKSMKLSKEKSTYDFYQGPKFIYIPDVKVH